MLCNKSQPFPYRHFSYIGPLMSDSILMCYDYRVLNQSYYLIAMPQVWISVQQNS